MDQTALITGIVGSVFGILFSIACTVCFVYYSRKSLEDLICIKVGVLALFIMGPAAITLGAVANTHEKKQLPHAARDDEKKTPAQALGIVGIAGGVVTIIAAVALICLYRSKEKLNKMETELHRWAKDLSF